MEMRGIVTLRLAREKVFFGPGVVTLLKGIAQTGSLKGACRDSGLSYSKAWKILNTAEEELSFPLVERLHGGKSGGGCIVTEKGSDFLKAYERIEKNVKAYVEALVEEELG